MTDRDKEVEKQLLQSEKAALDELKQAYTQALADVKAEVKELQKDPDIQSKIYQLKYQQALEEQLNTIIETLNDSNVTTVDDFLQKMYRDGYAGIIYSMQGYGIPLSTPINQELLIKAVTTSTDSIKISQRLYDNVQQFKKDIISEISRGLASNADYKTIALYIATKGKTSFNNAYRIARTEGHRTAMQAKADSITAARSRGADMVKVWDATLDGKTRASHARLHGQWREDGEEFTTYDDKGNEISTQYPGGFGIAEQDINCRCTLLSMPRWALTSETTYHLDNITDEIIEASTYDEWLKKYYSVDNSSESDIINTGAISGALNPYSEQARQHAEKYYNLVRNMTTDCKHIAENTGYTEEEIQAIKNYVFLEKHDLGRGTETVFDPSYEMAESWQRLIDGKDIQAHDLTLLKHETMESSLVEQGMTQNQAHMITSEIYNYQKEAAEYYDNIKKHNK